MTYHLRYLASTTYAPDGKKHEHWLPVTVTENEDDTVTLDYGNGETITLSVARYHQEIQKENFDTTEQETE